MPAGDPGRDDIVSQHVRFCQIEWANVRKHERTGRAAENTIGQCIDDGGLVDYLAERKGEVVRILESALEAEELETQHIRRVQTTSATRGVILSFSSQGKPKEGLSSSIRACSTYRRRTR